jgi:NAD(P)-dependent dehydrogenase (short-subunit alcohol dehydrogenase family)
MSTPFKKVILITGTSTGFGRDTAELLASHGHRVFAAMRDLVEGLGLGVLLKNG